MKKQKREKTNKQRLGETGELLNKYNKMHSNLKKGNSEVAEFIHSVISVQAESGAEFKVLVNKMIQTPECQE